MPGADFHEMIVKYEKIYSVDMTNYLWYFHTDEEGQSIGRLFFAAPFDRVKGIPVTPSMLTDFAIKGKWGVDYPNHLIPERRFDLLFDNILVGLFFATCLIWLLLKWTNF